MAFGIRNVKIPPSANTSVQSKTVSFSCKITKVVYTDENSGFYVLAATLSPTEKSFDVVCEGVSLKGRDITLVGNLAEKVNTLTVDSEILVTGTYELSKRTNRVQFKVTMLRDQIPQSTVAMRVFLSSGKINGIGPILANRIVNQFKEETINVISTEPEKLLLVEGIGDSKLREIQVGWEKWKAMYNLLNDLREFDISDSLSLQIYEKFGNNSLSIIKKNPYQLADISGISFKKVDEIAEKTGISKDNEMRIKAGIYYVMSALNQSGSTAHAYRDVIARVQRLLELDEKDIIHVVNTLIKDRELLEVDVAVTSQNNGESVVAYCLSSSHLYRKEVKVANKIKEMSPYNPWLPEKYKDQIIDGFLSTKPENLDQEKIDVLRGVLGHKVSVITGRPGTGKTRTLQAITECLKTVDKRHLVSASSSQKRSKESLNFALVAPTGRAAKQISKHTGIRAQTIHSLLGASIDSSFDYNENNKLPHDLIVVDESSMVDVVLMYSLLVAMKKEAVLILVGDVDQLASVGPGKVLEDIILSGVVPVYRLTKNFRQEQGSDIINAANDVLDGKMPELVTDAENSDLLYIEENQPSKILLTIKEIIEKIKDEDDVSVYDIQILTPKRRDELSVSEINGEIRPLMNPCFDDKEIEAKYQVGDKVMQTSNNPEKDIYNGDLGVVISVQDDEDSSEMVVDFEGKNIAIPSYEWKDIELAFAKTIHKSQGSEYQFVIIPITDKHAFMWDKKLLYTALTRAKKKAILIGSKNLIRKAVKQNKQSQRVTLLKDLLGEEGGVTERQSLKRVDSLQGVIGKSYENTEDDIVEGNLSPDSANIKVEKKGKTVAFGL